MTDPTDLAKRLRTNADWLRKHVSPGNAKLAREAADTIESLSTRLATAESECDAEGVAELTRRLAELDLGYHEDRLWFRNNLPALIAALTRLATAERALEALKREVLFLHECEKASFARAETAERERDEARRKEAEDIIFCIRSTTWSGTEEIVEMIRRRHAACTPEGG